MAWAPTNRDSLMNATARPIPIPSAASTRIHRANSPAEGAFDTCGHSGKSATVMPSESMTRAGLSALFTPGSGTKRNTPLTRTSVSRKPSSTPVESAVSPCIAAEISQRHDGVSGDLLQHPGQRQNERAEESQQPRNGIEGGVLNRGQDLDEAHRDARDEAHRQQRRAQPEGRH